MTPELPGRVPVLVAAAGASWEAEALDRLERGPGGIVLTKRCVDLPDLLASATAGLASVAVVAPGLPGLDADSVDRLRRSGVGVVLVAAPQDLDGGEGDRLRRLGIDRQVSTSALQDLAGVVHDAAADASPDGGPPTGPAQAAAGAGGGPPERGRLVAVWGPAGAPGRTTLAVGVADEVARAGRTAFLLDADPYGGSVAQHLGVLDESSGLLAAARAANIGSLDEERLASLARQTASGLRVLTGLPRPDRWHEVRPAAFEELLDRAGALASYVVADVGFSLEGEPGDPFGGTAPRRNHMTLAAVGGADEVLVVGAADPVGLARLARGLVELCDLVPGVRPRVVVNRTRASLGWTDREIRGMVEGFVTPLDVHFVPDDRAAADRALMAGASLAESGESPLRSGVRAVALGMVGETAAPARVRRRRAGRAR
jgi:MinD-like ATPase involved in chromosome partitioning or flagellar assembly